MDLASVKKAGLSSLLMLGVGFGQVLSAWYVGNQSENILIVGAIFLCLSIATFCGVYWFHIWWSIKRARLGNSEPMPLLFSPLVWVPMVAALVYLGIQLHNA
ncbi:hypothetical protein L1F30_01635 [Simiduia sp. 21SJ11W-1]|uniref:hypothetical protein n=1 Tax=Simiduia sp. 21SJ11W-1 TaxID=2909669 RepID=UPI0020A1248A|nr:hypothetical protein [Simiduia sp. 21SJ11W-1]UTA48255.1 hypothetical protein L1F30_01635 [Simiduia sp. 21SJ11W-1]